MSAKRRVTAQAIERRKGTVFPVMTAYDAPLARCAEAAGLDVLLVGDSLGNVVLGFESTASVELADMERHGAAVARGTERAHVIVDLPLGSYEASDELAVRSAVRLVKHGGASSVKLEAGARLCARVAAIANAGIPVVGHVGLMPQTTPLHSGYSRRGDRDALIADALAVEAAGAFALVIEMADAAVAAEITRRLRIPTIGIGSGPGCDAQVLVLHDVLGLCPDPPPFVKRYADLAGAAIEALRSYADEVRDKKYPA
jgi:3-methyl-2-oxobutanoate hydroxymethyltransferase